MRTIKWFDVLGFVAWLILVGVLTLTPIPVDRPLRVQPLCLLCGELGSADLVRNILLFAPAGLVLARLRLSLLAAIGLGLGLSFALEIAQMFVPGRYPTLRDVLLNGLGAGSGLLFYRTMAYALAQRSSLVLAASSAFAVLGVAATGWLMQPVATDSDYYAQWVPRRSYYAPWSGRVLDASVGGIPTRIGLLRETDPVRNALIAGGPVDLRFVQGDPPAALAAVYVVMDGVQREILMVGADGTDLVIRPRLRATDLRLDLTDQRMPRLLSAGQPGDTVQLRVSLDRHGIPCATLEQRTTCASANSLGAAWQLLLWRGSLSPAAKRVLHAVTLLIWLLPLGIALANESRRTQLTVLGATVVLMIAAGRVFGLAWPGLPELLAFATPATLLVLRRR